MEEQGAIARQATTANGDDENSQAEGAAEGAVGYARSIAEGNNNIHAQQQQQQQQNHPHYENIYESIEQYAAGGDAVAAAAAAAPAAANNNINQQPAVNNNNNNNAGGPINGVVVAVNAAAAVAGVAIAPAEANNNECIDPNQQPQPQLQLQPQQLNQNPSPPQLAQVQAQQNNAQGTVGINNLNQRSNNNSNGNNAANNLNIGYRNDLYDRTNNSPAYDVPRSVRSGLGMRRNLQLDLHGLNRNRCGFGGPSVTSTLKSGSAPPFYACRQRSFDDTESHHYYNMNYNPSLRYENIYEQIKDEPIYRNVNGGSARVYGRLNVIGHGIGRIERHLSSSCGNIDHYNLGGHYAVLGHSHFGTVGHIRLNTTSGLNGAPTTVGLAPQKDNNVKNSSSSFFSCLGGENSQSMNNIYRATGGGQPPQRENTNTLHVPSSSNRPSTSATAVANSGNGTLSRQTGAIPKMKQTSKLTPTSNSTTSQAAAAAQTTAQNSSKTPSSPEHSSTLNRISKSSLQWLLVNKWLPLWIGQGPDCKVIDFNFMFSRNCDGCDYTTSNGPAVPIAQPLPQDIVRFNGRAEMHARRDPSGRPLRSTLSRLRESELPCRNRIEENNYENVHVHWQNGFEFGRSRDSHALNQVEPSSSLSASSSSSSSSNRPILTRARSESPNFSQRMRKQRKDAKYSDPFKNYELNTENNTFKPRSLASRDRTNGSYNLREDSSTDEFQAAAAAVVETVSIESESIEIAAAAVLIEAPVVMEAAVEEPLDPDGIVVVEEIDIQQPSDHPTQD